MDFDTAAPMWMPTLPRRPAVTFTFDLQNLIRSSVWWASEFHCKFHWVSSSHVRYSGNKICPDERTNVADGQPENIMLLPTLWSAKRWIIITKSRDKWQSTGNMIELTCLDKTALLLSMSYLHNIATTSPFITQTLFTDKSTNSEKYYSTLFEHQKRHSNVPIDFHRNDPSKFKDVS